MELNDSGRHGVGVKTVNLRVRHSAYSVDDGLPLFLSVNDTLNRVARLAEVTSSRQPIFT